MAKLKVYRTPIGFHDAYVAAASQKAALAAWGADANLFAQGFAEVVSDPHLTMEPLSRPGEVIRKLRGSAAEHLNALGKTAPRSSRRRKEPVRKPPVETKSAALAREKPVSRARPSKSKPRPSRVSLDRAEKALADLERDLADRLKDIAARRLALDEEQRHARSEADEMRRKLGARRDKARADLSKRIEVWAEEGQ